MAGKIHYKDLGSCDVSKVFGALVIWAMSRLSPQSMTKVYTLTPRIPKND